MNTDQLNSLSYDIIGAAITVHDELGPGLDERDYELALSTELGVTGIAHQRQRPLPVVYKEVRLDAGYRIDILAEQALVVELKSVENLHPIHESQLLTYLQLAHRKLGLLLNFDVPVLRKGIRRRVMGLEEKGIAPTPKSGNTLESIRQHGKFDDLSREVLAAAIEVHRHLGPGLLKSAYEECICYELSVRGLPFARRKTVAVRFREIELPRPAEVDLVIADELPLMVVSVAEITPLLEARFIGRLKLGQWKAGLLLNFSEKTLGAGIRRLINPRLR